MDDLETTWNELHTRLEAAEKVVRDYQNELFILTGELRYAIRNSIQGYVVKFSIDKIKHGFVYYSFALVFGNEEQDVQHLKIPLKYCTDYITIQKYYIDREDRIDLYLRRKRELEEKERKEEQEKSERELYLKLKEKYGTTY